MNIPDTSEPDEVLARSRSRGIDCDFRALAKQSRKLTAKVTSARELMSA